MTTRTILDELFAQSSRDWKNEEKAILGRVGVVLLAKVYDKLEKGLSPDQILGDLLNVQILKEETAKQTEEKRERQRAKETNNAASGKENFAGLNFWKQQTEKTAQEAATAKTTKDAKPRRGATAATKDAPSDDEVTTSSGKKIIKKKGKRKDCNVADDDDADQEETSGARRTTKVEDTDADLLAALNKRERKQEKSRDGPPMEDERSEPRPLPAKKRASATTASTAEAAAEVRREAIKKKVMEKMGDSIAEVGIDLDSATAEELLELLDEEDLVDIPPAVEVPTEESSMVHDETKKAKAAAAIKASELRKAAIKKKVMEKLGDQIQEVGIDLDSATEPELLELLDEEDLKDLPPAVEDIEDIANADVVDPEEAGLTDLPPSAETSKADAKKQKKSVSLQPSDSASASAPVEKRIDAIKKKVMEKLGDSVAEVGIDLDSATEPELLELLDEEDIRDLPPDEESSVGQDETRKAKAGKSPAETRREAIKKKVMEKLGDSVEEVGIDLDSATEPELLELLDEEDIVDLPPGEESGVGEDETKKAKGSTVPRRELLKKKVMAKLADEVDEIGIDLETATEEELMYLLDDEDLLDIAEEDEDALAEDDDEPWDDDVGVVDADDANENEVTEQCGKPFESVTEEVVWEECE